jgi:macrolide-specific efflux system membrane fusion protein
MSADVAAAPLAAARNKHVRWAVVAAVVLVVAVAGVIGWTLLRPKTSAPSAVSSAVVARRTISVVVSGTGSSVVGDSVTVNPQISGTVKKLHVSLGETVTAGDDLYTISSTDVDSQLLKAKASLLQAEQSKTQAKQSEQQASSQVYQAKTQQIQAEQNLETLESKPATTAGIDDQITIAERQVKTAKAGVTSVQTALSAAQTGVDAASANLTSALKSYDDALADTENTVVTAPIDGVVTALPISVGSAVTAGTTSSSSSSGSSAGSSSGSTSGSTSGATTGSTSSGTSSSSDSAITISDMKSLKVQVSVSEVDIPSVTRGQKATVTFDALPGKTFAGTVGAISPSGTSSSGVVNYTVDIDLGSLDSKLRPNMTATADIVTQTASNVLAVPSAAVKTNGSDKYVLVLDPSGRSRQQVVTMGASDDTYVEVKSGVTEGQNVSTGSTASTSSTTKSSGATGGLMMGGGAPPAGGPGGN